MILQAMMDVLSRPDAPRTPDMGGNASTADVGNAIAQALLRAV